MGCELREYSWPDYWYVGREDRLFDSSIKVSEAALLVLDLYTISVTLCKQACLQATTQHGVTVCRMTRLIRCTTCLPGLERRNTLSKTFRQKTG